MAHFLGNDPTGSYTGKFQGKRTARRLKTHWHSRKNKALRYKARARSIAAAELLPADSKPSGRKVNPTRVPQMPNRSLRALALASNDFWSRAKPKIFRSSPHDKPLGEGPDGLSRSKQMANTNPLTGVTNPTSSGGGE